MDSICKKIDGKIIIIIISLIEKMQANRNPYSNFPVPDEDEDPRIPIPIPNPYSNFPVPDEDDEPTTAAELADLFQNHTISSDARVWDLMSRRYTLRAARNFLLNCGKMHLFALLATQTPRVLLDLITELGLVSCLKSLLKFLQVTHRKKKVGQIPCFDRQKICKFFFNLFCFRGGCGIFWNIWKIRIGYSF